MMERTALADRGWYQDRLAEAKKKGLPAAAAVGDGTMAEQQFRQQVHKARERSRELEEAKQQLHQQLLQQQHEARQVLEAANTREERAQEHVQQLQQQVSQILNTDNCHSE